MNNLCLLIYAVENSSIKIHRGALANIYPRATTYGFDIGGGNRAVVKEECEN